MGIDLLRAYYVLGVRDTMMTIVDPIPDFLQWMIWSIPEDSPLPRQQWDAWMIIKSIGNQIFGTGNAYSYPLSKPMSPPLMHKARLLPPSTHNLVYYSPSIF